LIVCIDYELFWKIVSNLLPLIKRKAMLAVNGIYENGIVRLEKQMQSQKTMRVIVTFLDDELTTKGTRLNVKDFSFLKSREKSKSFKGSLSDAVIEDRKAEL
jgi:hypothetical protein